MSTGFTFGAKLPPAPGFGPTSTFNPQQTGSITLGTPASIATSVPQFGSTFGAKTSTGFQFSSQTATLAPAFGSTAEQSTIKPTTTLNFGAPAQSTGFSLGTPATAISSTFGKPGTIPFGGPVGTQTPTAAGVGLPFGIAASTASGPASMFGSAPSTGLATYSTSVSAVSSPKLAFSTQISTAAPATGLTFGSPAPATGLTFGAVPQTSAPSTGLTFATAASPAPSTKLWFAAPTTSVATSLNFSSPAPVAPAATNSMFSAPASAAPTTALSFGVPASSAPSAGLTFGTSAPLASTFAAPSTSVPTTGLNFGLPSTSAPAFASTLPSTTAVPGFLSGNAPALNFKTPASTGGFSLGTGPEPPKTSTGLSLGLGGQPTLKPASTAATSFTLTSQPAAAAAPTTSSSIGLGGISAVPPKQPPTSGITTAQTEVAPADQPLPNELLQTVENFKKFVKEQKTFSSEIARFSIKDLRKVEADIDLMSNCINEMESELQRIKAVADKLKLDSAKGLQHVEMAQRTFDTPAGLQYDNTAPSHYFAELTDSFERDMQASKVQIENIDKYVRNTGLPTLLTPQDLALGMRRLHETFVALAGRLQSVHNQVELQKEQYLNLRKQVLNDYTDVFENRNKEKAALEFALDSISYQVPTVITGPTPFSSLGNSQAQILAQNPALGHPSTSVPGPPPSGFGTAGVNTSLFGTGVANTSLFGTSSTSAFQLQKPPVGNKRGKP